MRHLKSARALLCLFVLFDSVSFLLYAGAANVASIEVTHQAVTKQSGLMALAQLRGLASVDLNDLHNSFASMISTLDRLPPAINRYPSFMRIMGVAHLLSAQPQNALQYLDPYVRQSPDDVLARLALGHAHYMLGKGAESALHYEYVIAAFEQECCDPHYEGSLRQNWEEIQRRIREAGLLDAHRVLLSSPAIAAQKLEELQTLWPHDLMRLSMLLYTYERLGKPADVQRVKVELQQSDFQTYGLSGIFASTVSDLVERGIWTPQRKRRADLAFDWDMPESTLATSRPTAVDSLQGVCSTLPMRDVTRPNLLSSPKTWTPVIYASQAGVVADAAFRLKIICDLNGQCYGGILGLWQHPPEAGMQPARAGFLSPELHLASAGRYTFSFNYCTELGDQPDFPLVQVYIERTQAIPLGFRLRATRGVWQHYSVQVDLSEKDIRSAPLVWIASHGNGVTFFAEPVLVPGDLRGQP